MNALVYVNIDQGIHKGKMKVAQNEKRKKLYGFSFSINMANSEAFWGVKKVQKTIHMVCACPLIEKENLRSFFRFSLQATFIFPL